MCVHFSIPYPPAVIVWSAGLLSQSAATKPRAVFKIYKSKSELYLLFSILQLENNVFLIAMFVFDSIQCSFLLRTLFGLPLFPGLPHLLAERKQEGGLRLAAVGFCCSHREFYHFQMFVLGQDGEALC